MQEIDARWSQSGTKQQELQHGLAELRCSCVQCASLEWRRRPDGGVTQSVCAACWGGGRCDLLIQSIRE